MQNWLLTQTILKDISSEDSKVQIKKHYINKLLEKGGIWSISEILFTALLIKFR